MVSLRPFPKAAVICAKRKLTDALAERPAGSGKPLPAASPTGTAWWNPVRRFKPPHNRTHAPCEASAASMKRIPRTPSA